MRKKSNIIIAFLTGTLLLSSCLKDKDGLYWPSSLSGKMYAEIWQGGYASTVHSPTNDTMVYKFLINIASDNPPTQDITIKLKVNPAAVLRYDSLNPKTIFQMYPYIQLVDSIVTIKAGSINAYAHFKLWHFDVLDPCGLYMAPISIYQASGGVIPADANNAGSRLLAVGVTNPYVGDYHVVGYRQHPTLGIFPVDQIETLTQVNCNTVMAPFFGDYPYNVQIQVTTETIMVLGVNCFKCKVHVLDPSTLQPIDGDNQYNTFTGDLSSPPTPPSSDVNYYNPVGKFFVLNAAYNASAPRIMYEILTRQ